jgi:uncharacterized membrane protein
MIVKKLRNYLLAGLIVLLPAVVTIYIFWWLFQFIDGLAGSMLALFTNRRIPGLGFVIIFALVLGTGLLTTNIIGRSLVSFWENLIFKIPLVSSTYKMIKQVVEAIGADQEAFQRVVLLEWPRKGVYVIGFVTGETRGEVQEKTVEDVLNVFIVTTPNPTTGFLHLVPKSEVIPLDMSVEDGLKMVISGGIVTPDYHGETTGNPDREVNFWNKKAGATPKVKWRT